VPTPSTLHSFEPEASLEAFLATHSTRGSTLYLTLIGIVLCSSAVVATSSVDLTVRAPGVLRPAAERQAVRSSIDGVVAQAMVSGGGTVRAGDTLLTLVAATTDRAHAAARAALREQTQLAQDLARILSFNFARAPDADSSRVPAYLTQRIGAMAEEAALEWRHETIAVERAGQAHDRARELSRRGFGTAAELEQSESELTAAREGRALALQRRRAVWAQEQAAAQQRIVELRRDLARESDDRAAHAILAPTTGTVEELGAFTAGTLIRAGDMVATLSPDTALVAEVLVLPRDVGRLRTGMSARLLVEGYDVQQWGAADGVVDAIAGDYTIADGQPVFRVRVRPVHDVLRRPTGQVVMLRKGLRCQARFLVGRAPMLELLRHRAAEWADGSAPTDR
jgi:HlyD family secretion protein